MMREIRKAAYSHDDEYYYGVVRKNLRALRKAKGLTQQDVAEMTEMSREYICDIENKSRGKHVTIATLGRIAEALGVEIGEMFRED